MPRVFNDDPKLIHPAGLTKRLLAMVYDFMVVVAIWMIIGAVAVTANQGEAIDSPLGNATLKSALLLLTFLYFGYSWTKTGQTLGMLAWRLRIQSMDGKTLSWQQSLIRFFAAAFSLACLGLGYLTMLFGDEKLTWHDRWSDSVVVVIAKPPKR